MEIAFRVMSDKFNFTENHPITVSIVQKKNELEQQVINEDWYRIDYHKCFHDEDKPCKKWNTIASKGEVPQE